MATRNHILQKLTLIKRLLIQVKTEVDAFLKRRRNDVKRESLLYTVQRISHNNASIIATLQ